MKRFVCPQCNEGQVEELARPGRRMTFRNLLDLEVPADLKIPTCTQCGEEWIDRATAERIDAAMQQVYQVALGRKVEQAIQALKGQIAQQDLERLVGLSAGYLSKLKSGKEASSPLVCLLVLLAAEPSRLEELRLLLQTGTAEVRPRVRVGFYETTPGKRLRGAERLRPPEKTTQDERPKSDPSRLLLPA